MKDVDIKIYIAGVITGYVTLTLILVYLFRKRTVIKKSLTKKRTMPKLPWLKIAICTIWTTGLVLLVVATYLYFGRKA